MKELMMNEDFSDVTLVSEDKQHIKANIIILSTCSPVFKDILKKHNKSSQVIYLRGIQHSEMESIMQFIYLGEATFYEERMDEFLAVAKSLQIKGLDESETKFELNINEHSAGDPVITLTENLKDQTIISDEIKMQAQQERHGEDVNVNGRYDCDQCHKTYSLKGGLKIHKQSVHQGVKYDCNQCDHQFTQRQWLTELIRSKHEDVEYFCDQCDYKATMLKTLTDHIRSKHEGIKYACDQCNYQATKQSSLNTHIKSKHEGVKYACEQCNFKTSWKNVLSTHKSKKHLKSFLLE